MLLDNVETLSLQQKFGTQDVYFGSNVPFSPADGSLWYENPISNTPYPIPWYYNSSNSLWLSSPFYYDFGSSNFSATNYIEKSIPFYGVTANKILVRQVVGIVTNQSATAHTGSNYFNFSIRYTTGTATPLPETNAYTLSTDTGITPSALAGNASRRILENPNIWIPGNAWSLRFNVTKFGTPGNIYSHFGVWLQFGKG